MAVWDELTAEYEKRIKSAREGLWSYLQVESKEYLFSPANLKAIADGMKADVERIEKKYDLPPKSCKCIITPVPTFSDLVEEARKHFRVTEALYEPCGYISPKGEVINLTHHAALDQDTEIFSIFPPDVRLKSNPNYVHWQDFGDFSDYLRNNGYIRVYRDDETNELSMELDGSLQRPTKEQIRAITRTILDMRKEFGREPEVAAEWTGRGIGGGFGGTTGIEFKTFQGASKAAEELVGKEVDPATLELRQGKPVFVQCGCMKEKDIVVDNETKRCREIIGV